MGHFDFLQYNTMNPTLQKKQEINEIVKNLEPSSHRRQLIDAARAFKSNWVTFGEYLTRVATEKLYVDWGYRNFDEYCRVEIRIKKNTAIKLTNAYFFATQTEPTISESFEAKGVPELDVVNFLHKARQDESCTDEMFEDLKESAIEKGQSGPTLARRLKQMTAPIGQDAKKQTMEQSLSLVRRLQQKLESEPDIPNHFHSHLSELYEFISEQLDADGHSEESSQSESS